MIDNTDEGHEPLKNSANNESEKQSEYIIPSVETVNITPNQQTENMETHAHHLHKAPGKKIWHYFFEFLMLFLAITLGFLVENRREQFVEHHRENQYMQSLVKDLEQDVRNIESFIINKEAKNQIADSLTSYFLNNQYRNHTSLIYYCARKFSIVEYIFHMTDGTLMQLKNSGGLRLVQKKSVVDSLQSYFNLYQQYEDNRQLDFLQLRDYRETMIKVFDVRIFDQMVTNYPIITIPPGNPPLLNNDRFLINDLLIRVQFSKRINLVNVMCTSELKSKAQRLIGMVKKEYKLE
jgi:hypothetical protein